MLRIRFEIRMDMPNVNGSCVFPSQPAPFIQQKKKKKIEWNEKKNKLNGEGGKEMDAQVQLNGNEGHAFLFGAGSTRKKNSNR